MSLLAALPPDGVGVRARLDCGVRFSTSRRLAFEVEAGYSIAFVPEVGLRKSVVELEAVRAPFGLNPLRLGVSANIPIGKQAAR